MKKPILSAVLVVSLLAAGILAIAGPAHADACLKEDVQIISFNANGTATVKNTGQAACEVFIASYEIHPYSNTYEFIHNQRLFESDSVMLWKGETGGLSVNVPECEYQLDLVTTVKNPPAYQSQEFIGMRSGGEGLCGQPTPRPTPTRTPTPTPTPAFLACSPEFRSVVSGQYATFSATGGGSPSSYVWTAASGDPNSQAGTASFTTRFFSDTETTRYVAVSSGNQVSNCVVRVLPIIVTTPTPTIMPAAFLNVSKTVRNVSAGSGEVETVAASPNDTLEFIIRASTNNNSAFNVRISDSLPGQMSYVLGSTTLNGFVWGDGVANGGVNIGSYGAGQTAILRFRAVVAAAGSFGLGTTSLTNYSYVSADGTATVSDTAGISVFRPQTDVNTALTITKFGRNLTRGQSVEQTSVRVSNNDTVEFIVRVRSLSNVTLNNVIVTDLLPAGVEYLPRTTSVNNVAVADGIATGLNIGSLAPGQEVLIRFSGRITAVLAFPSGSLTVMTTVYARADSTGTVSAQLPLTLGSIVQVPTGPGESVLLALALSALVTAMYASYTRTNTFRLRTAERLVGRAVSLDFSKKSKLDT